ncbi:hypothetical protein C8R43DRAFT_1240405 [Mycena crocata]|nr:hypothetical protein C8R43DRAFT_1240405 [Mycena crocata]
MASTLGVAWIECLRGVVARLGTRERSLFYLDLRSPYCAFKTTLQPAQHFKFESSCDFGLSFRITCKAKLLSAVVCIKVEHTGRLRSTQVRRIPSRGIQFKV